MGHLVRYKPRKLSILAALLAFGAFGLHVNREDALAVFVMLCGAGVALADVIVASLEDPERAS